MNPLRKESLSMNAKTSPPEFLSQGSSVYREDNEPPLLMAQNRALCLGMNSQETGLGCLGAGVGGFKSGGFLLHFLNH
ncbi:hypothetical protein CesoFtcFv8_004191 [Champsocephalus esox]|uniref:Uncharacterized protein n=1 Tax=Champsocephalus esox TaxID=159716 RepID=A0AAN8CZQ0_9TELE|nr:hypothetical protein CesoFtcFv8_004191 [Champsocephalus esox]